MSEESTERFIPTGSHPIEIEINLERYLFAMKQCAGKVVLDLGCGNGLGTYLYSLVAEKVYAVDYSAEAIENASKYPFPKNNVSFAQVDLRNVDDLEHLPQHDICVALEILEHVSLPDLILRALKGKELAFSLPLLSLEMSSWHRYRIDTVEDVVALISPYYDVSDYKLQSHTRSHGQWVMGVGPRFKTNA